MIDYNIKTNYDNYCRIDEVLDEINKNPELLKDGQKYAYKKGSPLEKIFHAGIIPQDKFLLPDSDPPYRQIENPDGVNCEYLITSVVNGKLENFQNSFIDKAFREREFIDLLENVDYREAKVLLAIKDQKLLDIYPNITYNDLVESGYLPSDFREVSKELDNKSENNNSKGFENAKEGLPIGSKTSSTSKTKTKKTGGVRVKTTTNRMGKSKSTRSRRTPTSDSSSQQGES